MRFSTTFRSAIFVLGATAYGGGLGPAAGYNVFTLAGFQSASIDSGGAMAVGGNLTLSGYNVASGPISPGSYGNSAYALVVGGLYSGTTSVTSGNTYLNSQANGAAIYQNCNCGQTLTVGGTSPINFATAKTALLAESTTLAGQANNGTLQDVNNVITVSTGTGANTYYVTMTTAQLAMATAININFSAGSTVVVNVTGGGTATVPNGGFTVNGGSVNGNSTTTAVQSLMFNFVSASSLVFNGSMMGSVFAPNANVTVSANAQLDGQLVANSYVGKGPLTNLGGDLEFHNYQFTGQLPAAVPEPSEFMLIGLGLGCLGAIRSRKSN